jgi:hypothetical protein
MNIKTKFDIGNKVWFKIYMTSVTCEEINYIKIKNNKIIYGFKNHNERLENEVFITKEEAEKSSIIINNFHKI